MMPAPICLRGETRSTRSLRTYGKHRCINSSKLTKKGQFLGSGAYTDFSESGTLPDRPMQKVSSQQDKGKNTLNRNMSCWLI